MAGMSDEEMMGYGAPKEEAPPAHKAMSDEEMMAAGAPAQEVDDYYGPYLGWMSSLGSGMAKGVAALPGIPGDIQRGVMWATEKAGLPAPKKPILLPTSAQTIEAAKPYVPALNQTPETTGQKIAETIGEFAVMPGGAETKAGTALDAAGNLAKKLTKEAVIPGAASELAGQATEGTDLEPYARIAGAISPGVLTSTLGRGARALDTSGMAANIEAARRAGVDLPTFAAMESPFGGQSAAALQAIPLAGSPVTSALHRGLGQMDEAARNIHTQLGGANVVQAGSAAERGVMDWIRGPSASALDHAFTTLEETVPGHSPTPLTNLRAETDKILSGRRSARLSSEQSGATKIVENALQSDEPMTFEGARRLRTEIGNHLNNLYRLPGDVNAGELKRLYGALTKDLEGAARTAGGVEGERAFRDANRHTEIIRGQQNRLAKIVGKEEGQFAPETILGNIEKLAQTGTKGDINRLLLARRTIPPKEWEHVSAGILGKMGRDNAGNFSADRFTTGYSKISPSGKDALFGPPGSAVRDSLDNLAHLSEQFTRVGRHTNVSKTAHVAAYGALLHSMLTHPFSAIPTLGGSYALARVMSSPKTAPYAVGLARAIQSGLRAGASPDLLMKTPAVKAAYNAYVKSITGNEARPERASGGKVDKGYPAKRLTLAAKQALKEIQNDSRQLMEIPDEHMAAALHKVKE